MKNLLQVIVEEKHPNTEMKNLLQVIVKKSILMQIAAAAAITLAAGSAAPQQTHAQGNTSTYYYDNGTFPALYLFRSNGTGVRTTYPTGNLSFGTSFPFAWSENGNQLILQFPSGYTDVFEITGYDANTDTLNRTVGPWFGCRSGYIPTLIASHVCL